MSRPLLLDTCVLLWMGAGAPLGQAAEHELSDMESIAGGIVVSPISAWEVGQLARRGRLRLPMSPGPWFQRFLDRGMVLAPMPPEVLVASSFLPDAKLRDPADKILAATARAYRYRLMTRDRPLLDSAGQGHLHAIAC